MAAPALDRALDFLRRWEGGFVADPQDPGGATQFGISLRFLRGLNGGLGDIDGDGDVDADDVLALDWPGAEALYRAHFWDALGLGGHRGPVGIAIFDAAVNMGPRPAVTVLQRLCCDWGAGCAVDGVLGPQTRDAAEAMDRAAMASRTSLEAFSDRYAVRRLEVYAGICAKKKTLARYLPGWLNRVIDLRGVMAGWKA
jgi:lysozyme family protein